MPNYYAIIPANVRYDKDLTPNAKLLFGEITALCNEKGFCWASNEYFADLYDVSTRSITSWISQLAKKNYIKIEVDVSGEKYERKIHLSSTLEENFHGGGRNLPRGLEENFQGGVEENFYNNNTLINNTVNNTINNKKINKKEKLQEEFESLWKLYPRKLGDKKRALKAYVNAIKKGTATYESVKYGIEMYIKYNDYHNVQEEYIKHGSTWFHQECWNNDFTCKPKVIKGNRQGFLGLLLNEMDYEAQQSNVIDYEESMTNEQNRSKANARNDEYTLPFGF